MCVYYVRILLNYFVLRIICLPGTTWSQLSNNRLETNSCPEMLDKQQIEIFY